MKLSRIAWSAILLAGALVTASSLVLARPAAPGKAPGSNDAALQARLKQVQAQPDQVAKLVPMGSKVAAFCANCHGTNGNSPHADTPNLAGQNPTYLLGQMLKFADGRRNNEFMSGLVRAMTADEKIGAALFYARQAVTPGSAHDAALVKQGQAHYQSVCFRCHGVRGLGDEQFARLAGQRADYVALTLKRYRDGSAARADPVMADTTRRMSSRQIDAVAAYVASMQ